MPASVLAIALFSCVAAIVLVESGAGSWTWFVIGASCIALIVGLLPARLAAPLVLAIVAYGWGVISYLHGAFHVDTHWLARFRWFRSIRRLRDIRHWQPCNYCILVFGLDRLFGTLREDFPRERENLFPGHVSRP